MFEIELPEAYLEAPEKSKMGRFAKKIPSIFFKKAPPYTFDKGLDKPQICCQKIRFWNLLKDSFEILLKTSVAGFLFSKPADSKPIASQKSTPSQFCENFQAVNSIS